MQIEKNSMILAENQYYSLDTKKTTHIRGLFHHFLVEPRHGIGDVCDTLL